MNRILLAVASAGTLPLLAPRVFPGEPQNGAAFSLQHQTDDLALRPGEPRSELSILERDQVITATRGQNPGNALKMTFDLPGTTWTVSARLPETR
jgi:hypothetical protein